MPSEDKQAITFTGNVSDITSYFSNSSLYIHISRGDAFPTSTIEAMHAGMPIIMSEYTGTKEIIEKVDKSLILPLDSEIVAEKILWYMNLPIEYKNELSKKLKIAAENYTEKNAISHYQNVFDDVYEKLK